MAQRLPSIATILGDDASTAAEQFQTRVDRQHSFVSPSAIDQNDPDRSRSTTMVDPDRPNEQDANAEFHESDDASGGGDDNDDEDEDEDEDDEMSDDNGYIREIDSSNLSNHRRRQWRALLEDTTVPCEDELKYIESRPEFSALNHEHWELKTFFPIDDPDILPQESGRIEWLVQGFNGTQSKPNNEEIMLSPSVQIGGFEWRIKFYPQGDLCDFMSVYVENVTTSEAELFGVESGHESERKLPFPRLRGCKTSSLIFGSYVTAQIGVLMYNPCEPRTNYFHSDAHQFNKDEPDYGWKYFSNRTRSQHVLRHHGQRSSLLQNDKVAFTAYIRIIRDPTHCLWSHNRTLSKYTASIRQTGLRPFAHQLPETVALIPLCHFGPFRDTIRSCQGRSVAIEHVQTMLAKMYTRVRSTGYSERPERVVSDAVSCLRWFADRMREESGATTIDRLLGTLDPFRGCRIGPSKLPVTDHSSISAALGASSRHMETPMLLTLELERQRFNKSSREWQRLDNGVTIDDRLEVEGQGYTLFAFVTLIGRLGSNRHSAYVRPGGRQSCWYAYNDDVVRAMTQKQVSSLLAGADSESKGSKHVASPFSNRDRVKETEMAYLVQYVRDDIAATAFALPQTESWDQRAVGSNKMTTDVKVPDEMTASNTMALSGTGQAYTAVVRTTDEGVVNEDDMKNDSDICVEGPDVLSEGVIPAWSRYTRLDKKESSDSGWKLPTNIVIDSLGQDFYDGQFRDDEWHGKGHWIRMNGDEYKGEFQSGAPHGHGVMIYGRSGDKYAGGWEQGQRHGSGVLTEASTGNVYTGGWKHDRKHGHFVLEGAMTEEDRTLCAICFDAEINTAFSTCGHVIACDQCAKRVNECPICRSHVSSRLRLHGTKLSLA